MNEDCGHVADEELQKFKEESKAFCNLIKAEISGNRGEYKAFKTLEYLHSHNRVLKNVELQDEINRSELDAVVITPKCVTIIEVKNTSRNIFIDEEGNYFRTGEFLKWDCNIAEKMSLKEKLLRKVLSEAEMGHLQIKSILVFTNNHIEVQNKYTQIRTCFINQLVHIIDSFMLEDVLTERDNRCQVCGSKKHVEGHHIIDHQFGGAANIDNIVALCRKHHNDVHSGKIDIFKF